MPAFDQTYRDPWSVQLPATLSDRYECLETLSDGPGGLVLLCRDRKLGRRLVLKRGVADMQPAGVLRERFEREARILSSLSHPQVVRIYDTGIADGHPYFLMEHLEGDTLAQAISQAGRLDPSRAVDLLLPIGEGVAELHAHAILHRDLKPRNVVLDRERGAVLIDFGICKYLEDDSGLTATGVIVGTPLYMAPEVLNGGPASIYSDIYSIGAILYQMLSGHHPFTGKSPVALLRSQRAGISAIPGVGAEWMKILHRCLAPEPEQRFTSVRELCAALTAARAAAGGSEPHQLRARDDAVDDAPTLVGSPLAVSRQAQTSGGRGVTTGTRRHALIVAGVAVVVGVYAAWHGLAVPARRGPLGEFDRLIDANGWAATLRLLRERVQRSPASANYLVQLSRAVREGGAYDETLGLVRKAQELAPHSFEAMLAEGLQAGSGAKYGQADEIYRSVVVRFPEVPDGHVQLASLLLGQNRSRAARDEVEKALALDSLSRSAHCLFAEVLECEGRFRAAEAEYQLALRVSGNGAFCLARLAGYLARRHRFTEARAAFESARKRDPSDPSLRCQFARYLMELGELDQAQVELAGARELSPFSVDVMTDLGDVLLKRQDLVGAEHLFRGALQREPYWGQGHSRVVGVLLRQERWAEARASWEPYLDVAPWAQTAAERHAEALVARGDTSGAETILRLALQYRPTWWRTRLALAALLQRLGRWDEARLEWEHALRVAPWSAQVVTSYADALFDRHEDAAAERVLRAAVANNPSAEQRRQMAQTRWNHNHLREAKAEFLAMLQQIPESALDRLELARVLVPLKDLEAARREFSTVLAEAHSIAPDVAFRAGVELAKILRSQGERGLARKEFQRAADLDPREAEPHVELAQMDLSDGQLEAAESHSRCSVALAPSSQFAHRVLAQALDRRAKYSEMEKELRCAVSLGPKYDLVHVELGMLLLKQKRPREARVEIERAVELNGAYADSLVTVAESLLATGKTDEAIDAACSAVRRHPDDPNLRIRVASLLRRDYSFRKLEELLRPLLQRRPPVGDALHFICELARERGEREAAQAYAEKAIEFYPNLTWSHEMLAVSLLDHGDFPGAVRERVEADRLKRSDSVKK